MNTKLHFTRKFLESTSIEFEQIILIQNYNNIYLFLVENNGVVLT